MGDLGGPVLTKCWESYLVFKKCRFDRQQGTHHHWKCPDCWRTVTFWGNKKEVPRFHIINNLRNLGVSNGEFNKWVKENCK
ncbi:MAG TPA: hypothetical protein DIW47_09540 [Bacteroidetes bacterium]|nr:hypothetical protein [Bacteroidota bacterium]